MIYSYKIATDNGSAPCIMNNILSLTICKPKIRKKCKIGDYIVGLSSKSMRLNKNDRIIYIAKVTDVLNMKKYYEKYSNRIDCIYDINGMYIKNRFHDINCRYKDISGENSILSTNFIFLVIKIFLYLLNTMI